MLRHRVPAVTKRHCEAAGAAMKKKQFDARGPSVMTTESIVRFTVEALACAAPRPSVRQRSASTLSVLPLRYYEISARWVAQKATGDDH